MEIAIAKPIKRPTKIRSNGDEVIEYRFKRPHDGRAFERQHIQETINKLSDKLKKAGIHGYISVALL